MAEEKIARIAKEIYENVGGEQNVRKVIHCMTRVRMTIIDNSKVNLVGLKAIDGVMGIVEDDTLQVVVGPGTVNKVAKKMVDMVGVKLGETFPNSGGLSFEEQALANKAAAKEKYNKPSKLKSVLKSISNIFVPMIPAFVGTGIVAGIAAVLSNLVVAGDLNAATWQQYIDIMNILKNALFAYLTIYVGINAANEFGATPTLGGVIGGVVMLTGMNPENPIKNIFTGQPLSAGQGGMLGVLLAVWLLSIVEKKLHEVVPESVDIIVTPTISLIIIGLLEIFLIMPLAGFVSDHLIGGINGILNIGGAFSGFVLGIAFLPMVMLGLHQILGPIHLEMIAKTGQTNLLPILAMAGAGQVGAALAIWAKLRKDRTLVQNIKGALPVGILGVGEPLIYGVTLPMGRPFITACIGGGIGGAIIGFFGNVGAIATGPSGVALIPLIAHGKWIIYLLGLVGAYIGGFLATYFFGIPKDAKMKADNFGKNVQMETLQPTLRVVTTPAFERSTVYAPMTGKVKDLSEVEDEVFSSGMLGNGIAIEPTNGQVNSPVDGIVTTVFPTKHAIGVTSDDGVEILIHIGMDTVELNGEGFESFVKQNERVKKGDLLIRVNLDKIKAAGLSMITPIVVTNSNSYKAISIDAKNTVDKGQVLLTIQP
ncbi:MAG: glucose PTS transporter subunit IIA [Lactococcus raffinolactis]|jgi:sucrose PTS system EIIBCA or EIIBC component|uniref:PTS transporter subunit EIIC n=1 Tax=Pseudolactococcus raffinolactis TaxID=1366 RepID=A0AAE6YLB8_9LACT|nr:glucose PTS transporter subunit IIA [Lactococcus raffinolactis]MBP6300486.1 PTS glucose transporter subunit IIA [Lactococcus sp.]ATC62058.1 PTS beta-glucoside transporter subunit EIIBCA [Lactococcus raffinolactis]MDG4960762.1 glucose PTS transporter subunit IIA [Lactococcus raffinolactis]MDN5578958.1 glucose PTS transporter subunit IIA [Lactococcus raffinolactis]MDN6044494.1 glucose PTS transporter subunit IIA [Lactococcus raffinolactis]